MNDNKSIKNAINFLYLKTFKNSNAQTNISQNFKKFQTWLRLKTCKPMFIKR